MGQEQEGLALLRKELESFAREFVSAESERMPDGVRLVFFALAQGQKMSESDVDFLQDWLTQELVRELDQGSSPTERGRLIDDAIGKIQVARPSW